MSNPITRVIIALREHYLAEHELQSYADINRGLCPEFAEDVLDVLYKNYGMSFREAWCESNDSYDELETWPYHMWIVFNGRCYDAECPDGANEFKQLPFFVRIRNMIE
jgi:hypothetical protein